MAAERTRVVVLLGMHRSGTSLAMSVLHSLGVACGTELVPAGPSNPAGFWEHARIVAIHERLLAAIDRVWHGPRGSHPFPAGWLESEAARRARTELLDVVRGETARAGEIWGFKDPRTARLLPLWQQIFAEAAVEPAYILMLRHPDAVCASLERHNGVLRQRAQLIWLQHNIAALHHAGPALRLVLDYDRLIDNPSREVDRLAGALGAVMEVAPESKTDAVARIAAPMRTHAKPAADIGNGMVREVHQVLQTMAEGKRAKIDIQALTDRFYDMEQLFGSWISDAGSPLLDWAMRAVVRRAYR